MEDFMKCITMKKKNILKLTMTIVFISIVLFFTTSFGMQHYYNVDFTTGLVTATQLNVRSGPSTSYSITTKLYKGDKVEILETSNGWHKIRHSK